MKFYIITDADHQHHVETSRQRAALIGSDIEEVDIDPSQSGIKLILEQLLHQIDMLTANQPCQQVSMEESLSSGEAEALDSRPEASPPNLTKTQLDFQTELTERWSDLPYGLRADLTSMFLDEIRDKLKK